MSKSKIEELKMCPYGKCYGGYSDFCEDCLKDMNKMTNNKNECCFRCKGEMKEFPDLPCRICPCHLPQNTEGEKRHWCSKDCDECGNSLRKQEEHIADIGKMSPKVATSEKECENCSAKENNWAKHCNECNFIGCYQCIDEHSHTPHESEDWEAEFDKKYKKMVEELYPDYRESYNYKILKDIKAFIRKAYQRGREEALSLAVQEIGKEIQKIKNSEAGFDPFDAFEAGVFQGLDKAKSIISGVMKK